LNNKCQAPWIGFNAILNVAKISRLPIKHIQNYFRTGKIFDYAMKKEMDE